jgi:acetylornithine deacetylase
MHMTVFELTRKFIDIESLTGNEAAMGEAVLEHLHALAARYGGRAEKVMVDAAANRFNVLATFEDDQRGVVVTLSTHLDTVPPFFPSSEDDEFIHGRGACDVKGIIASMLLAAERVLAAGVRGVALLFVVGEERNSVGAYHAGKHPLPGGSKYIINGEPTENQLALGSKGALRYELIARGKMAHSAYPELGESAILKLLNALEEIRRIELPVDATLGASTLNIGVISGGRAPNVVPDEARAEILIRLVEDGAATKRAFVAAAEKHGCEAQEVLCIPAVHLGSAPGFKTTVVAFTTDIPAFSGAWGKPLLLGPGSIHVAHTSRERVPKSELEASVGLYENLVKSLILS